jgi:hypothetical protein
VTDYSPILFQPIVQGVVTFPNGVLPGSTVVFDGEGISGIARAVGFPSGAYILNLDEGLPGNAGAVQPGTSVLVNPNVRTMITTRGSGTPPISPITNTAVLYLLSPVLGVGADQVIVVMQTFPTMFADPPAGFEIIIWVVN